jgi:hypothetical protein
MKHRDLAMTMMSMSAAACTQGDGEPQGRALPPRAQRFPIQTPLRYRASGATDWIESRTINISRSGLLFHAAGPLDLKTVLEMQILFPTEITGGNPANVVCLGPVVRTESLLGPENPAVMAAAIVQYRFTRD